MFNLLLIAVLNDKFLVNTKQQQAQRDHLFRLELGYSVTFYY